MVLIFYWLNVSGFCIGDNLANSNIGFNLVSNFALLSERYVSFNIDKKQKINYGNKNGN